MAFVNGKEGHGVKRRRDLSANPRNPSDTSQPLTPAQLVRAAEYLSGLVAEAEERNSTHVFVPVNGAKRLIDALLTAGQQEPPRP